MSTKLTETPVVDDDLHQKIDDLYNTVATEHRCTCNVDELNCSFCNQWSIARAKSKSLIGSLLAALSAAEQRAEAMKRALMDLRHTQHYECEDPWYSCPLSPDGCANEQQVGCTCGTEAHNNRIDAAIASGAGEVGNG